jgi:hypothetical protein
MSIKKLDRKRKRPYKKDAGNPSESKHKIKRTGQIAIGFLLWAAFVVAITVVIFARPKLDTWDWYAFGVGMAVLAGVATWLSIGKVLHQIILQPIEFALLLAGRKIAAEIQKKRAKPEEKAILQKPRVAKQSLDVAEIHPSILRSPGSALVGYDKRRKPIIVDFGDNRHTLIGASTGGGKTTLLRSLLVQWLNRPTPPEIWLIDIKGHPEDALRRFSPLVHYVFGADAAMSALQSIHRIMQNRNETGKSIPPIIVVVDELAMLTDHESSDTKRAARVWLAQLVKQARSAHINLVFATQSPRFDIVPTPIRYNMTRKVLLVADSSDHAKSVLNERPSKSAMPRNPGEFILKELGMRAGKTILSDIGEIDDLVAQKLADIKDPRIKLWQIVSAGKSVGNRAPGINSLKDDLDDWSQQGIMYAYRNFAAAGVLTATNGGRAYLITVPFVDGVRKLQEFIEAEEWQQEPGPVRS